MAKAAVSQASGNLQDDVQPVLLKEPLLSAFLGWLIPGAGHIYQGRWAKGVLFSICILGTFFYGLFLGQGRVVYASWRSEDLRLAYLCQVGVGLPALPALVQTFRVSHDKEPLFNIMVPPRLNPDPRLDELALWHKDLGRYFELGTVYTMIAGLLNVLAIYDAYGGPLRLEPEATKDTSKDKSKDSSGEAA
jgi:hypothetical protein